MLGTKKGWAKEEPEAGKRREGKEGAVEGVLEPLANGVAVTLVDECEQDASNEGIEAGMGTKIDGAIEDEVVPGGVAEINGEAHDKGREPENAKKDDACAVAAEAVKDEEEEGDGEVELFFEGE